MKLSALLYLTSGSSIIFKQDELIELNGRKIKILNEPGLIRIGNLYD